MEILAAGEDNVDGIYAWHADGVPLDGWPRTIPIRDVPSPSWSRTISPLITDLDGDGDLEVGLGAETVVFFWDLAGKALSGRMPWPTFQADFARTGSRITYRSPIPLVLR